MGDPATARARARTTRARVVARPQSRAVRITTTVLTATMGLVAAVLVLAAVSSRVTGAGVPSVFGHPALSVLSGSMGPAIRTGDLVIADSPSPAEARDLRAGQIITYRSTVDGSRLFTHRIVGVQHAADGAVAYVTKGDANDSADTAPVPSESVVGLYRTRIPYGGYLLASLHGPVGVALLVLAGSLVVIVRQLRSRPGGGVPGLRLPARRGRSRGVRRQARARLARLVRNARPPQPHPARRPLVVSGVAAFAATGALVGSTLGLFTSSPTPETNTFVAGTVTLTGDAAGACTVTGMMPGDAPPACTFLATYTGSASAYLGLDLLIQTQAGSGGGTLYNPPAANNALTVAVTDNQGTPVTYTVPTVATTCPGTAPGGSTCYELKNLLVKAAPVTNATAITFSTAVTLPLASGNSTQAAAAQVILTAHAVQSKNQTLPGACAVGTVCAPTASFSWS